MVDFRKQQLADIHVIFHPFIKPIANPAAALLPANGIPRFVVVIVGNMSAMVVAVVHLQLS